MELQILMHVWNGAFDFQYKGYYSHRFSYMCFNGSIPNNLCVCHSCDNKICINPYHLWLGTIQENNQDRDNKNRQNKGESVVTAKFTEQDIEDILIDIYQSKYSNVKEICNKYQRGEPLIREILQGYLSLETCY